MRNKKGDDWFPFYVDKWLFGSTRIEFSHAERAIWIDLLTLSKKDSGFIRANEGIPYPLEQLAGMFRASKRLVSTTIAKAISHKKLDQLKDGTLFVVSTEKYTISDRHKRRLNPALMSAEPDAATEKPDTNNKNNSNNKNKNNNKKNYIYTDIVKELIGEWNKFAKNKAKESECFALERELSTVFGQMPELGKDEILSAVKNYKKALSIPNTQAHPHTLLQWLRRGHYKNYLPGYFNIDNYDKTKFQKGEREKSGAELLGLKND